MKRVIIYISLLVYIIVNIVLKACNKITANTLAIIIALVADIYAILPLIYKIIDDYSESKRKRCVTIIEPREYDKDLKEDIENNLNNLNENDNIVDSVQITETVGYTDHRKTVYIIYH